MPLFRQRRRVDSPICGGARVLCVAQLYRGVAVVAETLSLIVFIVIFLLWLADSLYDSLGSA